MKLKVISKYKQEFLILQGKEEKALDNQPVYNKKGKVAQIIDTIGSTTNPYYVAKIIDKESCDKAKEVEC
ncbi:Uncharacterised protein [uncultured archaeon]|nr:Uncharacterised protein [uncultured archaeon]